MFSAYYKDEAKTKECLDAEGFFHTGDIGMLVADGSMRVIDRLKVGGRHACHAYELHTHAESEPRMYRTSCM